MAADVMRQKCYSGTEWLEETNLEPLVGKMDVGIFLMFIEGENTGSVNTSPKGGCCSISDDLSCSSTSDKYMYLLNEYINNYIISIEQL